MRCPTCDHKIKRNATVCPNCGTSVGSSQAIFGGAARAVRESWGLPTTTDEPSDNPRKVSGYIMFILVALALVAIMLLAIVALQATTSASRGVLIDSENFPGDFLRQTVAAYDDNQDGRLSIEEARNITSINLSSKNLDNLAGIEYLPFLVSLNASNNNLVSCNLSNFSRLESINLSQNKLADLQIHGIPSLKSLDVSDNLLTALDVSRCANLESLKCTNNQIARLDLSKNLNISQLEYDPGQNIKIPLIHYFFADEALITSLYAYDLDHDNALSLRERQGVTSLSMNGSGLASLEGLTWFENLVQLDVSNTQLSKLDSACIPPSLVSLTAYGCNIKKVSLTGLQHLSLLNLANNPLTSLDLSPLTSLTTLQASECKLRGTLHLESNIALVSVDVSSNPNLTEVSVPSTASLTAAGSIVTDKKCKITYVPLTPVEKEEISEEDDYAEMADYEAEVYEEESFIEEELIEDENIEPEEEDSEEESQEEPNGEPVEESVNEESAEDKPPAEDSTHEPQEVTTSTEPSPEDNTESETSKEEITQGSGSEQGDFPGKNPPTQKTFSA